MIDLVFRRWEKLNIKKKKNKNKKKNNPDP